MVESEEMHLFSGSGSGGEWKVWEIGSEKLNGMTLLNGITLLY